MRLTREAQFPVDIVDTDLREVDEWVEELLRSVVLNSTENVGVLFERLDSLYDNPKVPVRFKIVYALSKIHRPESVEFLCRALAEDESELVRHEAASGLGEIGNESVIPNLITALSDDSALVRHESAMALDGIGDESALPELRRLLKDKYPIVTASSEVAISSILFRAKSSNFQAGDDASS